MNPVVSIILLNYNGKAFNKDCISSLLQQTVQDFEIIFTDNNSQDGSVEEVERLFIQEIKTGRIKIVKNKKNYGFAEGNNRGILHANKKSVYICLLNNDTIVEKNRLEELIIGIKSNEKLGVVGSLVLDKGSEKQLQDFYFQDKKGTLNNYIMETSFKKLTKKENKSGIFMTTGIGGCSMLFKKEITLRPFPEFYFAYAEDTFFSLSAILAGYECAVCSKSIVHHLGSGSFGKKISIFKAFHGTKNQLCNILILHSTRNAIKILPIFFIYMLIKILSSSQTTRFLGFIKAIRRTLRNHGKIKEEKKRIHKIQKLSSKEFIQKLSANIFENIYFIHIPQYQIKIMKIMNSIFHFYFKIVGL